MMIPVKIRVLLVLFGTANLQKMEVSSMWGFPSMYPQKLCKLFHGKSQEKMDGDQRYPHDLGNPQMMDIHSGNQTWQWSIPYKWGCLAFENHRRKWLISDFLIFILYHYHYSKMDNYKPSIWGYPPDYGNLYISIYITILIVKWTIFMMIYSKVEDPSILSIYFLVSYTKYHHIPN